jgi:hypothetical protein
MAFELGKLGTTGPLIPRMQKYYNVRLREVIQLVCEIVTRAYRLGSSLYPWYSCLPVLQVHIVVTIAKFTSFTFSGLHLRIIFQHTLGQ